MVSRCKWLLTIISILFFGSCTRENEEDINKDDIVGKHFPKLLNVVFSATDNPYQLVGDVNGEIIGDSVIECWIPNLVEDKRLTVQISSMSDSVFIDNIPYVALSGGGCKYDFKKPVILKLYKDGISKSYRLYVHSFTGLPVVWIETEGRVDITSKDDYLKATFRLVEDVVTRSAGDEIQDSVKIKGRGNSSWDHSPKKSFTLKFDKKVSLLDEPKDKSWLLIANYFDKSMLRNKTAFMMGDLSVLDYTPRTHFVEVMFNGRYHGTYTLCEKLKISKDRVDVGDDGFLIEVDERAERENAVFFKTEEIKQPFNIKDPDVNKDDENYNYVKEFVQNAEKALFSKDFKDPDEGWQKYMDITSFVDWFLINEIARNGDAVFYTSVYMNLKRGGKLKMGPLWDFDVAFGNNYDPNVYPTEGWYIRNAAWYTRLFQDPIFTTRVKERFDYFYGIKDYVYQRINDQASYLKYSVRENENRWGTLYSYTFPNHDIWGCYNNEVYYLKNWIELRMEWLKKEIAKL